MILAAIPNIEFIPHSGVWDSIFHQTWISLSILGTPSGGYKITLIGLIIIVLIALVAFAFLSYKSYEEGNKGLAFIYAALAILFQPLFKIYLGRELWNIVDVIVGVFLIATIIFPIKKQQPK